MTDTEADRIAAIRESVTGEHLLPEGIAPITVKQARSVCDHLTNPARALAQVTAPAIDELLEAVEDEAGPDAAEAIARLRDIGLQLEVEEDG